VSWSALVNVILNLGIDGSGWYGRLIASVDII